MGLTSETVCGLAPVATTYSAGSAGWRLPALERDHNTLVIAWRRLNVRKTTTDSDNVKKRVVSFLTKMVELPEKPHVLFLFLVVVCCLSREGEVSSVSSWG